jgi:nucleotide-binding universal stress UspA family protein
MDIKKVLVPVDFSSPSTLAVNHGVALACKFRAKLSLLHVVEASSLLLYRFPSEAEKVETQHKEQAEKMLPALVGSEDRDDLDTRFIVRAGEIEEVIASVVDEERADVIVMGTHGRGLFGRLFLGSVTQSMLRKLGIPVLTLCHVSRPLEFARILFATDLGPDSDNGFRFALDIASTTGCSLLVAHCIERRRVVTYVTPEVEELFYEELRRIRRYVDEQFAKFRAEADSRKVRIECMVAKGEPSETLVRIADENDVDFMILGLRKTGAMVRALLGSTAEPVIRNAHVPVLSVPIDTKVVTEHGSMNEAVLIESPVC